jgi:tryptophan 2,3-dioxygenase
LITLYAEQPQLHVPYQLLQRLVDIDGLLAQWRHRHALVVQRTIGSKLGTGGSSGYGYLRAVIEPTRVFRDISNLATYVIRPGAVPRLPPDVEYQLGSVFGKSKESNAA